VHDTTVTYPISILRKEIHYVMVIRWYDIISYDRLLPTISSMFPRFCFYTNEGGIMRHIEVDVPEGFELIAVPVEKVDVLVMLVEAEG
jgi:hypothetical protein